MHREREAVGVVAGFFSCVLTTSRLREEGKKNLLAASSIVTLSFSSFLLLPLSLTGTTASPRGGWQRGRTSQAQTRERERESLCGVGWVSLWIEQMGVMLRRRLRRSTSEGRLSLASRSTRKNTFSPSVVVVVGEPFVSLLRPLGARRFSASLFPGRALSPVPCLAPLRATRSLLHRSRVQGSGTSSSCTSLDHFEKTRKMSMTSNGRTALAPSRRAGARPAAAIPSRSHGRKSTVRESASR